NRRQRRRNLPRSWRGNAARTCGLRGWPQGLLQRTFTEGSAAIAYPAAVLFWERRMQGEAFQNWRRGREAIERKMHHLITGDVPASIEERQVRRTRFAALIERREAAARELLRRSRANGRDKSPTGSSRTGDRLIPAAHAGAGAEGDQAKFVPLPDQKGKVETAHVTTDASPSDVVALDAAALSP